MSSNYPTALDDVISLGDTAVNNATYVDAADHNNQSAAIIAAQTKIGYDGDTTVGTIDEHLSVAMFMKTDYVASDTTTASSYEDIDGLSMSVVLTKTSNVLITLTIGSAGWTGVSAAQARIYWDAAEDATQTALDDGGIAAQILKTDQTAGTYTCKAQHKVSSGETLTISNVHLTVIVIPVSLT